MAASLKGRKSSSGTSKKATRYDDNLFGTDTVELLLALSEGPIDGLSDGASTFLVGDVPLLDKGSNTPNISNFELRVLKGTEPADSIILNLGGTAATKNVGLDLRTEGQSIVVQGDQTQIDYIDFRFVVQRLLSLSTEGGEFPTGVTFKIEVKPRSSGTWQIPFTNQPAPAPNTSGASNYRPGTTTPGSVVNDVYRETYLSPTAPTAPDGIGAMWFNTGTTYWEPQLWSGSAWIVPSGRVRGVRNGFTIWSWNDVDGNPRTAWFSPGGTAPPAGSMSAGDYLLTPQSGEEVYSYNETTWVSAQNWGTPTIRGPGVIEISGLARSAYPKEYRVPVARINEPYDARVTRISPATSQTILRDINFESIQEVKQGVVSYPNLALAHLTIKATDTFTSIPEFTGVYRGLVIPVPSNQVYDPATKQVSFPGFWDGSFKMAYTNSPAWLAYNFIMNSRYGKNSYYPEIADKYDYYQFGLHCAKHGFRFNEYIQEARSLNELINYIVGLAGGRYVDRGDGYSTVLWDADDQPAVAIFSPENVEEGVFTYSFTDITERKNDFKVSFKNPQLNYREDRLRVWDQNSIDVDGRNPEEFVAVGCRDAEEAVKRGRLRLATALTEKTIATFTTNRIGRYLLPFQVVLIADDQSFNVISGRVLNPDPLPAGTTVLPLRDQVYLEAGISYAASFTVSDGNGGLKVVQYPLSVPTPGLQSVLQLAQATDVVLPEFAVFSMGTPKAFRITNIAENEDDKDKIDLTVLEINRLKWAFVDGLVELRDILPLQTGPLSKYVYPVTGAKITPESTLDGHFNLVVTWNASDTKLIRGYRVYVSENAGPMVEVYNGGALQYRINDAKAATYVVSIVAVGLDGTTESAPVTVQYIVADASSIRSVGLVSNLRLVDEPASPIFKKKDAVFAWDAASDPLTDRYRVEIINTANQVRHSQDVYTLGFTYSLEANKADNGGEPMRSFTIRLRTIDKAGNLSDAVTLAVSHPAPPKVIPQLTSANAGIFVIIDPSDDDYAGELIYIEKAAINDPPQAELTPKYDGKNPTFYYQGVDGTLYYVRVALYDSYGKTGLNWSTQQSIFAQQAIVDTVAPVIPDAPTLTSSLVKGADGKVSATLRATWGANPSANFGSFDFRMREGSTGDWLITPAGTELALTIINLKPATLYQAQLRAVNRINAAASGWSPTASITTVANTAPPGAITGLTVNAGFERATLSWTNPTDNDLDYIEVYSSATNSFGSATKLATVAAPTSWFIDNTLGTTGTRFYWVRPFNSSKIGAVSPAGAVQATSVAIQIQQIAAGAIDATKFAADLTPIKLVSALPPVAGYTGPKVLSYMGQLYSIRDGEWKGNSNSAADIQGLIDIGQIDPDTIVGNSAFINNIRAGVLIAGAIKTDMLDAGAVRAESLAILPNGGNLLANSDCLAGAFNFVSANNQWPNLSPVETNAIRSEFSPPGMASAYAWANSTPDAGTATDICYRRINADGSKGYVPVEPGQRYEFSVYTSNNRCSSGIYISWFKADGTPSSIPSTALTAQKGLNANTFSSLGAMVRHGLFGTPPSDTAYASLTIRAVASGEAFPFCYPTGWYFSKALPNQTELSPWVPQSVTIVNGGQVATDSMSARVIKAKTGYADMFDVGVLTADKFESNSFKTKVANTGLLTADNIVVGTGSLSSVFSGSNQTKINGGAIEANSLAVNTLKVGNRGIQTVSLDFYAERNATTGALTNKFAWTSGYILWTDNTGAQISSLIPAGSVAVDSGLWYCWWDYTQPNKLQVGKDNWAAIKADPNCLMMASISGVTGIVNHTGGIVLDGGRITAQSITTINLAADSISADKIQGEMILGKRIYLGKTNLGLDGVAGYIYANNKENTATKVVIGNVTNWLGQYNGADQYGLAVWGSNGELIMHTGGGGVLQSAKLNGAVAGGLIPTGAGANLLPNSQFNFNTAYMGWGYNGSGGGFYTGLNYHGSSYRLQGGNTWTIGQNDALAAGQVLDTYLYSAQGSDTSRFATVPGQLYEASVYIVTHRCKAYIDLVWWDNNDAYIGESRGNAVENINNVAFVLAHYSRSGVVARAPANAHRCTPYLRVEGNGQAQPIGFFTQPMFGPGREGQTEVSPWNPGSSGFAIDTANISTFIRGAIIGTAYITDAAITTAKIGSLQVGTANIGDLTVNGQKITAGAVSSMVTAAGAANTATLTTYLTDSGGGFQISVFMRGNGGGTQLLAAGQSTGQLTVKGNYNNGGVYQVEAVVCPISTTYQPGNGGNNFYTPAFGFSFTYRPGVVGRFDFTIEYAGALTNKGVSISAVAIAK